MTCCAVETFGRVGTTFLDLLHALAKLACTHAFDRGMPQAAFLRKWLDRLSVGVAKGVAACIEESLVGCAAVRPLGHA